MALNAKTAAGSKGPAVEPLEAGSFPSRLVAVVDLGLQPQRPYQGQEKSPAYEILTIYELVDEFLKNEEGEDDLEKPRWMSESFPLHNLSQEMAKSTKRYKSIDPQLTYDGNWPDLLDIPVSVTVIQNPGKGANAGKVYNNISAVSPMRGKDANRCPPLVNKPMVFDLDDPDLDVFNNLPQWIQNRIKENLEFAGSRLEKLLGSKPAQAKQEPAANDDLDEERLDDEAPY